MRETRDQRQISVGIILNSCEKCNARPSTVHYKYLKGVANKKNWSVICDCNNIRTLWRRTSHLAILDWQSGKIDEQYLGKLMNTPKHKIELRQITE